MVISGPGLLENGIAKSVMLELNSTPLAGLTKESIQIARSNIGDQENCIRLFAVAGLVEQMLLGKEVEGHSFGRENRQPDKMLILELLELMKEICLSRILNEVYLSASKTPKLYVKWNKCVLNTMKVLGDYRREGSNPIKIHKGSVPMDLSIGDVFRVNVDDSVFLCQRITNTAATFWYLGKDLGFALENEIVKPYHFPLLMIDTVYEYMLPEGNFSIEFDVSSVFMGYKDQLGKTFKVPVIDGGSVNIPCSNEELEVLEAVGIRDEISVWDRLREFIQSEKPV